MRLQGSIEVATVAAPREVARLVAYLAGSDADHVTGQGFAIDGGLSVNVGHGA